LSSYNTAHDVSILLENNYFTHHEPAAVAVSSHVGSKDVNGIYYARKVPEDGKQNAYPKLDPTPILEEDSQGRQ
jgi:hypothetical protein